MLSARDKINLELQQIIDDRTDPWGIKVSAVEVKELELPEGMKRAMARQAEAERERRAKVIAAEGELQAAEKLSLAAEVMDRSPVTLQLRYPSRPSGRWPARRTPPPSSPFPSTCCGPSSRRRNGPKG